MSLPSGYKQLEYIQSSGTQYIDTGVKPNQDYAIKIKVQTTNVNNNTFAGCDTDWKNTGFFVGANVFSFGNFATTSVQNYGESPIELFMDKTGGYKDGEKVWTISGSATFQTIDNLTLFVLTRSGGKREYLNGKFYYCLITDNEIPVREFIPCKNPDGIVGLYETVEGQFYQNSGTGEFTAGAEIKGSHRTLIDGTSYAIKGGTDLIAGTSYQIGGGRTLVDGTEYEIGFVRLYTVTITASYDNTASATINGTKYTTAVTLEVESGTEIKLHATRIRGVDATIKLNSIVVAGPGYTADYTHIVETDTRIYLNESNNYHTSEIRITTS